MTLAYSMSPIFGKLMHQRSISALRKQFWCILRGVRLLLATAVNSLQHLRPCHTLIIFVFVLIFVYKHMYTLVCGARLLFTSVGQSPVYSVSAPR